MTASFTDAQDPNYFEWFGLPLTYRLDRSELEARYRQLSQHLHPDRQASFLDAPKRQHVLRQAADLNQAYRTLRDDYQRALHLLQIQGYPTPVEASSTALDPAFLLEMLEWQEQLQEARKTPAAFQTLTHDLQTHVQTLIQTLECLFADLFQGQSSVLATLTQNIHQLRYYRRLQEQSEETDS